MHRLPRLRLRVKRLKAAFSHDFPNSLPNHSISHIHAVVSLLHFGSLGVGSPTFQDDLGSHLPIPASSFLALLRRVVCSSSLQD